MNNVTKLSLAFLFGAVGVVRLIPHPERTSHGFGELFHTTSDPHAAQMRILPGSDEDHFTVVETQGKNCKPHWDNICAPPYHYHTFQNETFEVTKGMIKIKLDGEELVLRKGDGPLTIPHGHHHTFIKAGNDDMEVLVTLRPNPGNKGQRFFPNLFGTIRDKGPSLPQILYIFCTNGVRLSDIPWPIHEVMCVATRVVAPILGYRHEYPEYEWKE